MKRLYDTTRLAHYEVANKFFFPPIKTGLGTTEGKVTEEQLNFYRQISSEGPGVIIVEPVAVAEGGREHPRQLAVHLPDSWEQLQKISEVIHQKNRFACLHLNHAGAAANPKASGSPPKAPTSFTCPTSGLTAVELSVEEIREIIEAYRLAAQTAKKANFDFIEIQAGHGYLISQFLNEKLNKRTDQYGQNTLLFAEDVITSVRNAAPKLPVILRISGNEMSPEFGISPNKIEELIRLAEKSGVAAIHVGMGNACFSPPWYYHHGSLPEKPQLDALTFIRSLTSLPIIAAGRMGSKEKIEKVLNNKLADFVALGRPLLADSSLIEKWKDEAFDTTVLCGYCLQGCLHRVKNGQPIGCNLNPELGLPKLPPSDNPKRILIVGGGPAGLSAAKYLIQRGHRVDLIEKKDHLGGQFALAWQAPGKQKMREGLDHLIKYANKNVSTLVLGKAFNTDFLNWSKPDVLICATGSEQNIPQIDGLEEQNVLTSVEFFERKKDVRGPRVLVIGAGRTGLEITEILGTEGYEVVATKRSEELGNDMEMITKKLILKRLGEMQQVTLMPKTTVRAFTQNGVTIEKEKDTINLEPFQTIILASGMKPPGAPNSLIAKSIANIEVIGDANTIGDIYSAIHQGYEIACKF
ncbi:FAD-dependent oxidoreductase [bacterium]|nr:FAD-dependent oxidoreductase [bacterium]